MSQHIAGHPVVINTARHIPQTHRDMPLYDQITRTSKDTFRMSDGNRIRLAVIRTRVLVHRHKLAKNGQLALKPDPMP